MAKKLLCLFLVLTLVLSMSMVSFAECGGWEWTRYFENAYCVTPICAGQDIPTQYGYRIYQQYCPEAVYTKRVLETNGCCQL